MLPGTALGASSCCTRRFAAARRDALDARSISELVRVGRDRHLQRRAVADRARVEHFLQLRGEVDRVRVTQRNDLHLRTGGTVHAGDDLRDAPHVVRVVGHDDRVVRRIGGGVVRRDQRPQPAAGSPIRQIRCALITWSPRARRIADVGRHALQLRVGSGTTFSTPWSCTSAKPLMRNADCSVFSALFSGTGRSATRLSCPFTRGSTMMVLPVAAPIALATLRYPHSRN